MVFFSLQSTSATTPCISFVKENKLPGTDEFDPKFSIQIEDIKELKKLGGLGWKTKLVVGGLLGMEVIDGMTLITPEGETTLTALPRRDELFNRLIALSQNVSLAMLLILITQTQLTLLRLFRDGTLTKMLREMFGSDKSLH